MENNLHVESGDSNTEPEKVGKKIVDIFEEMPEDEQIRFFVSYITTMLTMDQQKTLVQIMQGRLIM